MRVPLSTRKDKNIAEVAKEHYRKHLPTAISEIWAAQTTEEFERAYAKATEYYQTPMDERYAKKT